ncbi:hypothetical protein MOQ_007278 [Trypanosoma cruzi marinkellei]|uniref:DUF4456 domain-containing protein n=1 Tax=Trypanosoma cruzi marinkellei TaxID=85056 RepID=K2MTF0_TRYCR|nr:hypothetical protein MOQ_007278 [Trypanosoma cruzi marinkellei]
MMVLLQRTSTKESRLQTRMAARYHHTLGTFHDSVREFNKQLDEEQMLQLLNLKEFLRRSHEEWEETLRAEMQRVECHKIQLAQPTVGDADDVLQPFTDYYHKVEVTFDDSKVRLRDERQRLLYLCVESRNAYQMRVDAIAACEEALETREKERRERLKKTLVEFVEALTKISYTSIGASHVMAQRAIHDINEHLCKNQAGRKTLLAQLRCREILRQRHYSRQLADVYGVSLELMMRSSLQWAVTLLKTAYFRRPRCRMQELDKISQLVSSIRRDGTQFIGNVSTTVQTLRRAREPQPMECGQVCGGTLPDGWLRSFDSCLFSPVFPVSPSEVTMEWRVKANVLVRNIFVQCATVVEKVRIEEERLCEEAELILKELHALVQWISQPEEKETEMLERASLHGVDDVYMRFTNANTALQAQFSGEVDTEVLPLLATIRRESEWFTSTVEIELNGQHGTLEGFLLTGSNNVLMTFEKATNALEVTATKAFGFIRSRFIELYEARKDHDDALQRVEAELARKQQELQHSTTVDAAEKLFVENLLILERIAAQHANFHRHTVQSLQRVVQEGQTEMEQHCAKLLLLFGLESEEACVRRERELAAAAAAAEAAATKKGRGRGVVVESESETDEETLPPYPTITAVDGQLYFIIGPPALEENLPASPEFASQQQQQQKGRKSGGGDVRRSSLTSGNKKKLSPQPKQRGSKKIKDNQSRSESGTISTRCSPMLSVVLPPAFLRTYEALLKDALKEDGETTSLSLATVEAWCEMLRVEVLNWTVHLRHASMEHLQKQCNAQKSAVDEETNEILRHHRRRPARMQFEFEGRVREVETAHLKKENHCARLRERFAALETAWSSMVAFDDSEALGSQLFEQLQELEKMASKTNAINVLVSQERNFASLVSSSLEAYTNHHHEVLTDVTRQKESLESECRSFLLGCGKSVPDNLDDIHDTSVWDDCNDSSCKEVMDILLRLHNAAKAIKEKLNSEREQHVRRLDAMKSNYTAVFEQNAGELQLLARLQEIFSRLKVQVHSLTTLSENSEVEVEEMLKEIEEKLSSQSFPYDFSKAVVEVMSREYGVSFSNAEMRSSTATGRTSAASSNTATPTKRLQKMAIGSGAGMITLTQDRTREVEAELNGRLAELRIETQRHIRSSDPSKVMRLLDHIREKIYVRGRHLDCLQYGVELFNVPQENYIDPRLGAASDANAEEAATTAAGTTTPTPSTVSFTPQGRPRSKSKASTIPNCMMAALYTTTELPEVIPAERQLNEWLAVTKSQVETLTDHHLSMYPPPLLRRLSGMSGGNLKDVMEMCNRICDQQQRNVSQYMVKAVQRYREQVQRLFVALQKIPSYLVNSTYTLSSTAMERRVATVFDVFAGFYGDSDTLRSMHDRLAKVTLASNYNRDKLNALLDAEKTRQSVTHATIEKIWGYALREIEDEAAMHAARSINVNNNFFAFLRGVVQPENLKPADDDGGDGRHRGLRSLLRLKAKENRTKEMQQYSTKRERRLRETMNRQSQGSTSTGGKKLDPYSAADALNVPLPVPSLQEVEHGRVPLRAVRPLEMFNADHPDAEIAAANIDVASAFARISRLSRFYSLAGNRRQKNDASSMSSIEERAPAVSIVAPETPLHMEMAKLTQQSVEHFNNTSSNAVDKASDAFQKWTEKEGKWRENWGKSMKRILR